MKGSMCSWLYLFVKKNSKALNRNRLFIFGMTMYIAVNISVQVCSQTFLGKC